MAVSNSSTLGRAALAGWDLVPRRGPPPARVVAGNILFFSAFIVTCVISHSIEGPGIPQVANSTNLLARQRPYLLVPLLLLRMRAPLPFTRRF